MWLFIIVREAGYFHPVLPNQAQIACRLFPTGIFSALSKAFLLWPKQPPFNSEDSFFRVLLVHLQTSSTLPQTLSSFLQRSVPHRVQHLSPQWASLVPPLRPYSFGTIHHCQPIAHASALATTPADVSADTLLSQVVPRSSTTRLALLPAEEHLSLPSPPGDSSRLFFCSPTP